MFKFKDKKDFVTIAENILNSTRIPAEVKEIQPWVVEAMEKSYTQGLEDAVRIHKFKGE